ncbi:putative TonB-dependent receptor BfrD [Zhongshania aliphaticivorans]|uniref:Putative TonB-dependent receptor BfrD n=1 Tax=Zhongshania aliphaticivorans TaxID=1470434 RepID=A0A5S9NNN5_9GAMM|nr:TonB-dependent siderophore receptor [Zhongshania aliphaticivorans]CAA0091990.1 putative TonB-dependent receptor BfrD [Zhongshania aliphaticivorans]CAA0099327.1 putative TonB-dependent receptor BfrD [Zhongshania aliphaticivorans]
MTCIDTTARPKRNMLAHAIGIAIASSTLPAIAAEEAQETLPAVKIESSVITPYKTEKASSPQYTQKLADTPKTISVVPEQVLRDQAVTSLRDALRNVSGITMQAGEGGAAAGDNLSIRGFDATNDLYVDGVRDIGSYSRDTFNLEQIEVTKGPSSAVSGRGSAGGSVNLVSKEAQFDDFKRATVMVGNDSQLRATADINGTLSESLAGRINLMTQDSGVPGRDVTENKGSGFAGALTYLLSDKTRISGGVSYLDQDNIPDGGVPLLTNANGDRYLDEATAENYYGVENRDYDKNEITTLKLAIDHDFSENLSLRNQTFIGATETSAAITRPSYDSTTGEARRGSAKARDEDRDIISNQTTLRADFTSGNVGHNLVVGMDLTQEEYVRYQMLQIDDSAANVDLYNPVTDDPYNGSITRTGGKQTGTFDAISLYANDTLTFTPKWMLTLGVRIEDYEQEYSQNYSSTNRDGSVTAPFTYDANDTLISWNAAITYKPAENGSIYLGVGNAQTPLGSNLTLSSDEQDLDAEEDQVVELGTKWELFNDKVLANAALFRSVKTNASTTDVDNDDVIVLEGEQIVQGLELGINGAITDQWAIIANYTYTDSEITESGDPTEEGEVIYNTPEHSASLWTTYQLDRAWQVGGGLQYIGDYQNGSTTELDAVTLVNATASFQATKNLKLQLNANNLTDEKYLLKPRGSRGVPGTGKSVTVTASLEF